MSDLSLTSLNFAAIDLQRSSPTLTPGVNFLPSCIIKSYSSIMSFKFEEYRLAEYSSSELASYIVSCSPISSASGRVVQLSPNLVAKHSSVQPAADEVAAMDVARELGILVPEVKRVVTVDTRVYIIMERVRGNTLEESWPRISWKSSIRTAFQLRRFVRAMRRQRSSTAGALRSGKCNSIWLEDYYGLPPHATPETFTSFINFWLNYVSKRKGRIAARARSHFIPATSEFFVFTHQDLAPRNLLIDENDDLWIVDWELSGWYPIYFEYVSMQNFQMPKWSKLSWLRWWLFSWISVGIYRREKVCLGVVRYKFTRNPIARKSVVLEEGAHFDAIHLRRRGM